MLASCAATSEKTAAAIGRAFTPDEYGFYYERGNADWDNFPGAGFDQKRVGFKITYYAGPRRVDLTSETMALLTVVQEVKLTDEQIDAILTPVVREVKLAEQQWNTMLLANKNMDTAHSTITGSETVGESLGIEVKTDSEGNTVFTIPNALFGTLLTGLLAYLGIKRPWRNGRGSSPPNPNPGDPT